MNPDYYAQLRDLTRRARRCGFAQWADNLDDKLSVAMTSSEALMMARWELEQLVVLLGADAPPLSERAVRIIDEITRGLA